MDGVDTVSMICQMQMTIVGSITVCGGAFIDVYKFSVNGCDARTILELSMS